MLEICIGNKLPYDITVLLSQKSRSSKPSKTQMFSIHCSVSDCSVLFAIHVAGSVCSVSTNKERGGWGTDPLTNLIKQEID